MTKGSGTCFSKAKCQQNCIYLHKMITVNLVLNINLSLLKSNLV